MASPSNGSSTVFLVTVAAVAAGFGGPFGVVVLRSAWQWALPAA